MADNTLDDAALALADRHFQTRVHDVPLLQRRAEDEGVKEIASPVDAIAVMFPHTIYKSYPPQAIERNRWDLMNRWLDSLSSRRITTDVAGVTNIDEWLERLLQDGHYVVATSGTTGKNSFLNKSIDDLDANRDAQIGALIAAGVEPDNSWSLVSLSGGTGILLAERMTEVLMDRFASPDTTIAGPPSPKPKEGHMAFLTRIVALRRAMAEGTASPAELAAFETENKEREAVSQKRLDFWADALIANPDRKYLFGTFMALAWRMVETLRARGVKPGDLTGANAVYMAGGLKGAVLPPDVDAQIMAMLNIEPRNFVQLYGMQEVNLMGRKCVVGNYHPDDGLLFLLLDEPGEGLVPIVDGMGDGRAAFIDTSAVNRWGGVITGDRVQVDYGCACGQAGPAILPTISRWVAGGDDKITCAGTMDAYVRGVIGDD